MNVSGILRILHIHSIWKASILYCPPWVNGIVSKPYTSLELNTLSFHEMRLCSEKALTAHKFDCHSKAFLDFCSWLTVSVSRLPKCTACCLLGTIFPLWHLVVEIFLLVRFL